MGLCIGRWARKPSNSHLNRARKGQEKGKMMFCLADVSKALEIGNPSKMKTRLDCGYVDSIDISTKSKNQYGEFKRTMTDEALQRCSVAVVFWMLVVLLLKIPFGIFDIVRDLCFFSLLVNVSNSFVFVVFAIFSHF